MKSIISLSFLLALAPIGECQQDKKTFTSGSYTGSFALDDSLRNHPEAHAAFLTSDVVLYRVSNQQGTQGSLMSTDSADHKEEKQNPNEFVPTYLYTLFCSGVGFQDTCRSYGGPPGQCMNIVKDFGPALKDNITAISTNTQMMCLFYENENCAHPPSPDGGITIAYAYNLASKVDRLYKGIGPWGGDHDNKFSSYLC